ncbi:TonB-dependent receptor [Rugamonas sp. FT81W]|uniref:TonB-dependent receptor n=1 Tax=Duganella vulcania TaxID=2692166 RepID=A0A845GVN7_9BURK|nr:TonB-dependent receptor [Duganella vulcania]
MLSGQGSNASFSAVVQSVQVTGRRNRIDVSNTNNGAVFTAKDLAKLPVRQTLNSIVLLAPNTTKGDSAYGNTASFGGSGQSENAFYLNGFPITNSLSQLGAMELPFGAIQQASVMTGGFGAEFGRSIGGVLSVTSKSGTNTWEAGATYSVQPNGLRAKRQNVYYPVTGDKNNVDTDANLTTLGQAGFNSNRSWDNRWLGKLDWNINDNHRLEFTSAGNSSRTRYQRYGFALNPNNPNALAALDGTPTGNLYTSVTGKNLGATDPAYPNGTPGAVLNMLKYTGQITDDLAINGLYGKMKTERGTSYEIGGVYQGSAGGLPPTIGTVAKTSQWSEIDPNLYRNYNVFPGNRATPGSDEVKSGRLDIEYKIGTHLLRAGIDSSKMETRGAGNSSSGGCSWTYRFVGIGNANQPVPLSGSRPAVVSNFGGSGVDGYYARQSIFSSITDASATQSAQYIDDKWQVTPKLLVTAGIRNDAYSNSNGDGQKFIDMKNEIAPRLAAAWDVNGDASSKVYGSAGRYFLQLPTGVAARAASRSTLTTQDFTYTGVSPTDGTPMGNNPINAPISVDGEYGTLKNLRAVVMADLKPNYQDEITLGCEKAHGPDLNFGVKATYRKLGAGIDDSCDTRPLYAFALAHGIEVHNTLFINCFIYNPGKDVTVWGDGHDVNGNPLVTGKGQFAHFTAAEIGEPKAERTYAALDFFLEHPLRQGWYGKVFYTLSRSRGNMEGQTRSDTGQKDVGTSAAWDFPEFAPGNNGLLPNDRKHQLKAYGFYQITPEWSAGANVLIQSGRPVVCLGTNDAADQGKDPAFLIGIAYGGPGYNAEYFNCGGVARPRGSMGRLPWAKRLDLNLVYAPEYAKGLSLKVEVFNALNGRSPLSQTAVYDDGDSTVIDSRYNQLTTFQTPRSAKFTVEYNRKF